MTRDNLESRPDARPDQEGLNPARELRQSLERRIGTGQARWSELEPDIVDLLAMNVEEVAKLLPYLQQRCRAPEENARRYRLLGRYCHAAGERKRASYWTRKALKQFTSLGHRQGITQCRLTLLDLAMYSARYREAESFAEAILSDPHADQIDHFKVLVNLGNLHYRRHRYKQAETHFKSALKRLKGRRGHRRFEAITRHNLGCMQVFVNQFGEAKENFQRARSVFRDEGLRLYEAHVLQALANLNSILGQVYLAETQLQQASDIYRQGGDAVGAATATLDLFKLHIRLNRLEGAQALLEPLLAEFHRLQLSYEKGLVLYEAAGVALREGDDDVAEPMLKDATRIFAREGNHSYLVACRIRRSQLARQRGRIPRALEHLQRAHEAAQTHRLWELELIAIILRAETHPQGLQTREIQRMHQLVRRPISPHTRCDALVCLSRHAYSRNAKKKAIMRLMEAIIIWEEIRASITEEEARMRFLIDKSALYDEMIDMLFNWRSPAAKRLIFRLIQLSRARRFSEHLARSGDLPLALNRDEPAWLEWQQLESRKQALARKIQKLSISHGADDREKELLLSDFKDASEALARYRESYRDERRLGHYFPFEIDPDDILNRLPDRHLVVLYFLSCDRLYRLEMDGSGIHLFKPQTQIAWSQHLNTLVRMLSNPALCGRDRCHELLDALNDPLRPHKLAGNRHIVFIPHRSLLGFPWSVLKKGRRPLLQTHSMSICPTLPSLFFSLQGKAHTLEKPLFLHSKDPADPHAREGAWLARKFPHAVVLHDLNPEPLTRALSTADFIHFAGHGHFNRASVGRSFLELGGDRFHLDQLGDIKLNRPFFNLAACRTGALALADGHELLGFVVSFLAAGASTLLASLWDVDDDITAEWMTTFYQHLNEGPHQAHRQACLTVSKTHPEPYFWAPFNLYGQPV